MSETKSANVTVAAALVDGQWVWRAECGHYLTPRPVCWAEANPPIAYCGECEGYPLVTFPGLSIDAAGTVTVEVSR